jgi:hypothetical protein
MRWAALVAGIRERYLYSTLVGKPEEKRQLEDLDVDGRIILKFI